MKSLKLFLLLAGVIASAAHAQTSDSAPTNLSSVFFNGTITSATGGANGTGTINSFFASNGLDYTVSPTQALTDPAPFVYVKTGASTGRITEAAVGNLPAVSVTLTFSNPTTGTFVATYANSTQSGSFTLSSLPFSAPLVNVSTRTTLAPNGTAITGFVVGGSASRRVLIRAIGPGLTQFSVSNALTNPAISLWQGATQIGANDDFSSGTTVDATLPTQFASVGAFALTPGSRDAAIVMDLAPGPYTAQIRGGSAADAGEVLLEVYFLN